jgi:uncharacterized protein
MSDGVATNDPPLDPVAVRVLGCLVEKEITTPDNYPLTLNALAAACNQTSNREPIMSLEETGVLAVLDELTRRSLARVVHRSDSRAKRYRHLLVETLKLHPAEVAVLCVLMLRGPQTPGEIRVRAARLHEFDEGAQLELTLQALMSLGTPLVAQLPRQPGQKEARYAHLLAGEPEMPVPAETAPPDRAGGDRIEALEQEVTALREELAELRGRFDRFAQQFQ